MGAIVQDTHTGSSRSEVKYTVASIRAQNISKVLYDQVSCPVADRCIFLK